MSLQQPWVAHEFVPYQDMGYSTYCSGYLQSAYRPFALRYICLWSQRQLTNFVRCAINSRQTIIRATNEHESSFQVYEVDEAFHGDGPPVRFYFENYPARPL